MTKEYNFLVMSPPGDVHTTAGNEMPPPASTGPYKTTHHTSPIPERKTYSKEKEEVSYLNIYLFIHLLSFHQSIYTSTEHYEI